jgi:hypothetical protein
MTNEMPGLKYSLSRAFSILSEAVDGHFVSPSRDNLPLFQRKDHNDTAMVDVFLVISTIVGLGVLLVAAVYLLIFYQHPDDHNEAYMPKLVVLLGFVLAGATVLLLPLDVANNEGYAGTYRRNLYCELREGSFSFGTN